MTNLVIIGLIITVFLSYELNFTKATLYWGKTISGTDSKTGFQDAITPPWQTNTGLGVYLATLVFIVYAFYSQGLGIGFLSLILILASPIIFWRLMPHPEGAHYKRLITQSMMRRYADFKKEGDVMRATAMAPLLAKMGCPVPDTNETPHV